MTMADNDPDLIRQNVGHGLDALIEHFELEPRNEEAGHDAYEDCVRTAQVYMKLKGQRIIKKKGKKDKN